MLRLTDIKLPLDHADAALTDRHNALFQGSHVVSGQGEAVAVVTRLNPSTLTVEPASLDEVFLTITGHRAEEPTTAEQEQS